MTEPLNISHPFDRIWAGDPYDPTPATFPDEGNPTKSPPPATPKPAPSHDPGSGIRQLVEDHTDSRTKTWYSQKFKSEAACVLPCKLALRATKLEMPDGELAEKMMDHFLSGSSEPVRVDLDVEFARNPELREYVAARVQTQLRQKMLYGEAVTDMNGAIWVPQEAYGASAAGHDQQLALGGTYMEYQVVGSAPEGRLEVEVDVADHYFWSPSERGRPTHCLHVCGARLVTAGKATEFFQFGEGRLIVDDPLVAAKKAEEEARNGL